MWRWVPAGLGGPSMRIGLRSEFFRISIFVLLIESNRKYVRLSYISPGFFTNSIQIFKIPLSADSKVIPHFRLHSDSNCASEFFTILKFECFQVLPGPSRPKITHATHLKTLFAENSHQSPSFDPVARKMLV
jgi:hypothetical protein